jgi:salicylate hydroxylase
MHTTIVGGGIAGLTAALCLARRGISSTILEQAKALDAIGAGVQLSPNATRILLGLGLGDELESVWHEPARIELRSGANLSLLATVPAGETARHRWGAPYAVIHRADLQQILYSAIRRSPEAQLELGQRIEAAEITRLETELAGTVEPQPNTIIAADGVWSVLRPLIAPGAHARFVGQIAWRMTIDARRASSLVDPTVLTAFLGPSTHVVAYPLPRHGKVNLVAITTGRQIGETWNAAESDRGELRDALRGWASPLVELVQTAVLAGRWPIHQVSDCQWHKGKTVLIGDAAHAMPPYAAQGAAMAIEDAAELADCLAEKQTSPETAFARYEAVRRPRIARVRSRAAFNRFAYHASGPIRIARDIVLRLRSPDSLAADFDWLYGY